MTPRELAAWQKAGILDSKGGPGPWRDNGICAQTDPEAFFPEKGQSTREPKQICNGGGGRPACPARGECLAYALVKNEQFGIWGGKSLKERRNMDVPAAPVFADAVANSRDSRLLAAVMAGNNQTPAATIAQIVRMRTTGMATTTVAKQLHVSVRTVERVIRKYREAGGEQQVAA